MSKSLKVLLLPTPEESGSGLTSQISFDNPDFMEGLRVMFGANDDERITQIEIYERWVVARFDVVRDVPV